MNAPAGAPPDLLVGLDAGTSAIKVVVAECGRDGVPLMIGMGSAAARGIRRGSVAHLDSAAASIHEALSEAELTAGITIRTVDVALSGAHLCSVNSRGVVAIAGRARQVTASDTARAIEAARPLTLPGGREILHAVPQEFVVDEQDGVPDPVGMAGARLEVNLHVITGNAGSLLNLFECIRRCGVAVSETIVGHLACAEAVLTDDEKTLGVALVDVGAGTTSIAVFERGVLVHSCVLSVGGDHVTNDLAVGLRTPPGDAERLKRKYGRTFPISIDERERIEIAGIGALPSRSIPRGLLTDIVALRAHTLLEAVADELRLAGGTSRLSAGVVLTGGGGAIRGLTDTAERILGLPVRRAFPSAIGAVADLVNTASCSTAVGVVLCAARRLQAAVAAETSRPRTRPNGGPLGLRTLLRGWR